LRNLLHRSSSPTVVFCLALVAFAPGIAEGQESGYHSFGSVTEMLEVWAREHPELVELKTIGRSAAGAPLLVARVAASGEVDPDQRPAIFVGANVAGFHNAGTEAALDLLKMLLSDAGGDVLKKRTFYVAPVLNPDAHDAIFHAPKQRLMGSGATWSTGGWRNVNGLDRDLDGLDQEDGPNDLNGDGLITMMRIPDPAGRMLPDPDDPRVMIPADPLEGEAGLYRVVTEGVDDDGDGSFNEDGPGGLVPDRNFAHAFEYDQPETGPWASFVPETQAIMDFLLARRNVAVAVVYGPANNLLTTPKGFGGGGDTGSLKFKVPERMARFMGIDPEQEYTADEIWEVAKDLPMVVQNNITKEQMIQFLGAGPATKLDDDDLGYLTKLAETYKERLEEAGLDNKRPGKQYGRGGFTPWLYYQYGVLAIELDVWGVPKAPKEDSGEGETPLTLESLAEMSVEDFLALGEEKVAAFLSEIGAPPQFTAAALIERVESGQVTPERVAEMAKRMGAGTAKKEEGGGPNDLMVFVDEHAPGAFVEWTKLTLPDGTEAEVGGVDPFIEIAPPYELLAPALKVHTETVLELADRLAWVEIVKLESTSLGAGVHRVEAVAANRGFYPTHTKMAERARSHLPVRLEITLVDDVELITGHHWVTEERLAGQNGTMTAEWMVRVPGSSTEVVVEVFSENAGYDRATLTLGGRK
jgi:hypothetical protein